MAAPDGHQQGLVEIPKILSRPVLSLDWRNAPDPLTLIRRLEHLVHGIDHACEARMTLKGSMIGVHGAKLHFIDADGNVTDDTSCRRVFAWESPRQMRKGQKKYLAQVMVVAIKMAQDLAEEIVTPYRMFKYQYKNRNLSNTTARRVVTDIALTLGVHPFAFGIVPDVKGVVAVPKGFGIEFKIADNILNYTKDNSALRKELISGPLRDQKIPSLVHSLTVLRQKKFKKAILRAVVVIEHVNVKYLLTELVDSGRADAHGLLIVMTSGFADTATRSFLHMLERDPLVKDQKTPFLFFSDHDPSADQICSHIMHGSLGEAYHSLTTTCNSLIWAGVTVADVRDYAAKWPERAVAQWASKQNNAPSEKELADKLKNIQHRTQRAMIGPLSGPAAKLNLHDKRTLTHFHKYDNFPASRHPVKYAELLSMGMMPPGSKKAINPRARGEKFSLCLLGKVNPHGVSEALMDKVREHVHVAVVVTASQPATFQHQQEQQIAGEETPTTILSATQVVATQGLTRSLPREAEELFDDALGEDLGELLA